MLSTLQDDASQALMQAFEEMSNLASCQGTLSQLSREQLVRSKNLKVQCLKEASLLCLHHSTHVSILLHLWQFQSILLCEPFECDSDLLADQQYMHQVESNSIVPSEGNRSQKCYRCLNNYLYLLVDMMRLGTLSFQWTNRNHAQPTSRLEILLEPNDKADETHSTELLKLNGTTTLSYKFLFILSYIVFNLEPIRIGTK